METGNDVVGRQALCIGETGNYVLGADLIGRHGMV